jgi:hypothetical protein
MVGFDLVFSRLFSVNVYVYLAKASDKSKQHHRMKARFGYP